MSDSLNDVLLNLEDQNQKLYREQVHPGMLEKVNAFLEAFEDYFRERGFVVKKKDNTVRVAFDSLEFSAYSNDSHDIFITKDSETIASVAVKVKDVPNIRKYFKPQYDEELEKSITVEDIESEKAVTKALESPVFYYTGSEFGHKYSSPLSVLESIFPA